MTNKFKFIGTLVFSFLIFAIAYLFIVNYTLDLLEGQHNNSWLAALYITIPGFLSQIIATAVGCLLMSKSAKQMNKWITILVSIFFIAVVAFYVTTGYIYFQFILFSIISIALVNIVTNKLISARKK